MTRILIPLLFALAIAGCKKEEIDESKPLRNPLDYPVFRQADSACVVNNGTDSIPVIHLEVTRVRTQKFYDLNFPQQYVQPGDTFKYNMRLLPLNDDFSNPFRIPSGDTFIVKIKFKLGDHIYKDPTLGIEGWSALDCVWEK